MKRFALLLISLLTLSLVYGQAGQPDTAHLKSSAQKMGEFFIGKNYDEYVKYVHPKILQSIGGKDKMIAALRKSLEGMEKEGFVFTNVSIGEPSAIIYTNKEWQSVVPQILEIKVKDGRLVATAYLLAISSDKGAKWYFVDTSGKTLDEMKSFLPSLSDKLVIPKKAQPVFYND